MNTEDKAANHQGWSPSQSSTSKHENSCPQGGGNPISKVNKRLIVTPARCNGCKSCELACAFYHSDEKNVPGVSRIKVYSYTEEVNSPVVCQQCDDAACVRVCPTQALALNETSGVVEFDKDKCIHCKMCAVACPFGNIVYDKRTDDVVKCDNCGGDPVCAKFCPTDALVFDTQPKDGPMKPIVKKLPPRPWSIKPTLKKWRRMTQVGIGVIFTNSYLGIISSKTLYDGPLRAICIPGLNCHSCPGAVLACPIGLMQHFMAIQQVPFYVLGYLALIGILVGRAACGWICPFGWIQDMMYKIKSRKFRVPKILHHFKWVSLILLTLILPYFTSVHWFSKLCPYGGLIGAIPWALWNPIHPVFEMPVIEPGSFGTFFWIKMTILAGFLLWFILAKRPFCKVACPLGLIFSWFNNISLLKMEVPRESCSRCMKCRDLCPTDLDVSKEIETSPCIKCLDCTACGHVESKFTFRYGFTRRKRRKLDIEYIREGVERLKNVEGA